jgi:hypothetical protein
MNYLNQAIELSDDWVYLFEMSLFIKQVRITAFTILI